MLLTEIPAAAQPATIQPKPNSQIEDGCTAVMPDATEMSAADQIMNGQCHKGPS